MSAAPTKLPWKSLLINAKAKLLNQVRSGTSILQSPLFLAKQSIVIQFLLTCLIVELLFGFGAEPQLYGLTLRTWLLAVTSLISAPLFFSKLVSRQIKLGLVLIGVYIVLASILGFKNHHSLSALRADITPFLYFCLVWAFTQFSPKKLFRIISVFTLFAFSKSLIFFIGFTTQTFLIHEQMYRFIRDVWSGKITFVTDYFYRIVFPEHLLLVPLFVYFVFSYQTTPRRQTLGLMILSGTVLALNFSRAYFLALAGSIITLLVKNKFSKQALQTSFYSTLAVILPLVLLVFTTSHGKSFGLELFSARLSSIIVPSTETSGATRLALLEPIKQQIRSAPWFGQGLGSSVTFLDPVQKQMVTTTQYDWGYLELLAELGIVGTTLYLAFWFYTVILMYKKQRPDLSAALFSLLIVSITTPALFHVYGIIFLAICLAGASAPRAALPVHTA